MSEHIVSITESLGIEMYPVERKRSHPVRDTYPHNQGKDRSTNMKLRTLEAIYYYRKVGRRALSLSTSIRTSRC